MLQATQRATFLSSRCVTAAIASAASVPRRSMGAPKPIKWKPLIAKELATCGGRMRVDELRKAAVAEARAHPSHSGRQTKELKEEFDRVLPTFKRFVVEGNQVRVAS